MFSDRNASRLVLFLLFQFCSPLKAFSRDLYQSNVRGFRHELRKA